MAEHTETLSDLPTRISTLEVLCRFRAKGCGACENGIYGFQVVLVAEAFVIHHSDDNRRYLIYISVSSATRIDEAHLEMLQITYQVEVVDTESLNRLEELLDLELRQVDDLVTTVGMRVTHYDKGVDVTLREKTEYGLRVVCIGLLQGVPIRRFVCCSL
jgi:hypothetical protein